MIPYWILFLTVMAGALSPWRLNARSRRLVWFALFVAVTLMIGYRHDVGGDWGNYWNQFQTVAAMSFTDAFTLTKDPAYYPLGWVIAYFGGEIYELNLVCAALLVAGTFALARRQTTPWVALLAAVPYLLIVVGMGYTRQAAALGCTMLGLVALADGRARVFVFWTLVGAAFHKSAALLIPIAALASTQHRVWTAFWVAIMAAFGYWIFVSESTDQLWTNYVESDYAMAAQGAGIRTAMNVLPASLFLVFRRKLAESDADRLLWTWISLMAIACIPMLSLSATAVDRMALYLLPIQIVVFGRLVKLVPSAHGRTAVVVLSIAYFALVEFVWLNFANHAHAWVPYMFRPLL